MSPRISASVAVAMACLFPANAGADSFDGHRKTCDSTQQQFARAAVNEAKAMLASAIKTLPPNNSVSGARFKRWFGGAEGDDDPAIKGVYREVAVFLDIKQYWCPNMSLPGDSAGRLAFVPANSFFEIFLDAGFFNLGTTGADTRGGTIVHEAAHQATTAKIVDTDRDGDGKPDYGIDNAMRLAKSAPGKARRTADNLEYYVEDTAHGIP